MKNIVLGAVLALAAIIPVSVNAADAIKVCAGAEAKAAAEFATGDFVKVAFTPKCSANVFLEGTQVDATTFTVGSASAKGKSIFSGSTAGGSVCVTATCGTAGKCEASDASTGTTKAAADPIVCL